MSVDHRSMNPFGPSADLTQNLVGPTDAIASVGAEN